jgi:hypothetical protein
MRAWSVLVLALLLATSAVYAKQPEKLAYPSLEPVVANLGPGCQIKLKVPNTGKFTSGIASGTGAASMILSHPPYWNDDWFLRFTCYSANADSVPPKNDTVAFDNKKQCWIRNPANTDIIPEQHLKVYQIKTPNAQGWAYTEDVTATEFPERLMQYCVYHGDKAICGDTDVGSIETIHRHPLADRTSYVLKILNSIEFLEDAPPPSGNAASQP